jgi:uncharacterized protein (DUF2235 family)
MAAADPATIAFGPRRRPRKLVLCFDGTGNKFQGDDSDTNILKIYRMLDRNASDQCKWCRIFAKGTKYLTMGLTDHYYQREPIPISSQYYVALCFSLLH